MRHREWHYHHYRDEKELVMRDLDERGEGTDLKFHLFITP
jgi:hypothetical protein